MAGTTRKTLRRIGRNTRKSLLADTPRIRKRKKTTRKFLRKAAKAGRRSVKRFKPTRR